MKGTTLKTDKSPHVAARFRQQPQNRSLERGIEILRAFKPGADLLGNGELAERTGLSPATVSRLTQTLVGTGMLEHDARNRAYRLAAPVLSLAHAMRSGSPVLNVVAPIMVKTAERLKVNVGLAVADRDEMVYLESVRYNRKVSLRHVVAGQRVPIELTSLGRAYLAALPEAQRLAVMTLIKHRRRAGWAAIQEEIERAISSVNDHGYCAASWQPEVIAIATPVAVEGHPIYVLNMSVTSQADSTEIAEKMGPSLIALKSMVQSAIGHL